LEVHLIIGIDSKKFSSDVGCDSYQIRFGKDHFSSLPMIVSYAS